MQPSWPTADYLSKVSVVVVQRVTGRGYHDYLSPKLKVMCPYIFTPFMAGRGGGAGCGLPRAELEFKGLWLGRHFCDGIKLIVSRYSHEM